MGGHRGRGRHRAVAHCLCLRCIRSAASEIVVVGSGIAALANALQSCAAWAAPVLAASIMATAIGR
jgi:hypothetical protein